VYPTTQVQEYPSTPSMQEAPFKHGELTHSSTDTAAKQRVGYMMLTLHKVITQNDDGIEERV
jgi:hypothetical protein